MPIFFAAVAILGLVIGSFLNVVIYRVPRGESLMRPGSHCPECHETIRTRHNIPLFSWLMLRGRCAQCRAPISIRYPIVELITGLLFVAVTIQVIHLGLVPALPAYLFFTAVAITLAAIDLDVRRLPNDIVYPAYLALAVLLTLASVAVGSLEPLVRAGIGAAALFAFYFALAVIHPTGMGFGDVKLAGVIGAALGFLSYPALLIGAFAAFLIGGLIAAGLIVMRRASRKTAIPFGPAMLTGAFLAVFASAPLADAYTHLVHRA